jgi:hypothetical protein
LPPRRVDVTLPVRETPAETGRIHPISQVMDELTAIFADMGFSIAEGPDIETDDYNFTKLNFPPGPSGARDARHLLLPPKADGSRKLLRTHTSPVQVRTMLSQKPPIRVICPGRTYRCDSRPDAHADVPSGRGPRHRQGLASRPPEMDSRGILQGVLRGRDVKMRFRPSFFPFTEPSMEVDIQCSPRQGGEIRFGEGEDWLEILGCGMVHPNVLRNCGLDPDVYQGFAWGMGIDRIAMLKYGMPTCGRSSRRRALAVALRLPAARPADAGTPPAGGLSREKEMKFTLSWLKDASRHQRFRSMKVVDTLTMIGLEVEHVDDKAKNGLPAPRADFTIAYVISAEQHPNADRLRVCMVDTGAGAPCRSSAARRMRAPA